MLERNPPTRRLSEQIAEPCWAKGRMAASAAARHHLRVERTCCYISSKDLAEISDLVRWTCDADDEVKTLVDRFCAGLVSVEKLKAEIRALALRH